MTSVKGSVHPKGGHKPRVENHGMIGEKRMGSAQNFHRRAALLAETDFCLQNQEKLLASEPTDCGIKLQRLRRILQGPRWKAILRPRLGPKGSLDLSQVENSNFCWLVSEMRQKVAEVTAERHQEQAKGAKREVFLCQKQRDHLEQIKPQPVSSKRIGIW